jgi:cellulose synthase/poly-beta-1,6-N-acetylglucosamine synthase-like glycosyltransferase
MADGRFPRTVGVVVPARDEAAVIASCLASLIEQRCDVSLRIVVVVNGTTDATADIARALAPQARESGHTLVVHEIAQASKCAALNEGDLLVTSTDADLIRLYVDADVVLSPDAVAAVVAAFDDDPTVLMASPPIVLERSTTCLTRAYASVWSALPYVRSRVMGAGFYAVAPAGRTRWETFPELLSDDKFVRLHFAADEQRITAHGHISVRLPARLRDLVRVRSRWIRGNRQLRAMFPELADRDGGRLLPAVVFVAARPGLWPGAAGFAIVYLLAMVRALAPRANADVAEWERGARPAAIGASSS